VSRCCTSVTTVLFCALAACTSAGLGTPPYSFSGTPQLQGSIPLRSAPAAARSWIAPGAHVDPLLYVVENGSSQVAIFKQQNRQLVGAITTDLTLPTGVWVDTQRNLWVANATGYGSTIMRFPPGSTAPDLQLSDSSYNVFSIWVASDGAVYVVNGDYYGFCQIVEYAPHKKVGKVVGDPLLYYYMTAIVGDAKGDLFASGIRGPSKGGPNDEIDERPAGSKRWQNTGIQLGVAGGLGFDASGNLVAADDGTDVIETFPPGQTTPSNTIQCSATCVSFAFNHRGDHIWIDEYTGQYGDYDTIEERAYPSGALIGAISGLQTRSIDSVATSPDLYP
jgi:hypothetical protein